MSYLVFLLTFRVGISLFTVAAFALSVFSQSTAIAKEEFDKVWQTSFAASRGKAAEVATETEVNNDGNIISTDKSINQFLAPDRYRSLIVVSSGARSWKDETIEVGNNGFKRKDDGKWLQYSPNERIRMVAVPSNVLPASWSEDSGLRFYVSDSILDGQSVRVFSAERKGEVNGIAYAERDSIWISADGLLLKTESEDRETIKSNVRVKRIVSVWSYDPFAFKIEAPVTQ